MIQRRSPKAPCSRTARRHAAPCGAYGAQTGAALLRRTARSVNAPDVPVLRSFVKSAILTF